MLVLNFLKGSKITTTNHQTLSVKRLNHVSIAMSYCPAKTGNKSGQIFSAMTPLKDPANCHLSRSNLNLISSEWKF